MIMRHGGDFSGLSGITDLSVNLNPMGMPDSLRDKAIKSIYDCEKYPDPYCRRFAAAVAQSTGVTDEQVVCGNGAADLIYRTVNALKPKKASVITPTFTEYEKALEEAGCEVKRIRLSEEKDFELDEETALRACEDTDMVFICSPNNPTGRAVKQGILRAMAEKCKENDIWFVCDESFIWFAELFSKKTIIKDLNEKCMVIRSLTKMYAMPGIRVGYMVCGSADAAYRIRMCGQCWSVSVTAQVVGAEAARMSGYDGVTSAFVAGERAFLQRELERIGIKYYPSDVNFVLFRLGEGYVEKLFRFKVLIRECSDFDGLDGSYYRAAVRTREENERLIYALERTM